MLSGAFAGLASAQVEPRPATELLPGLTAINEQKAAREPIVVASPMAQVDAIQLYVRDAVGRVAPGVFAVTAFGEMPGDARLWRGTLHGQDFATMVERTARNCGSAFAISADGELLTNEHVVSGAASVWVTDDAGRVWPALVVGTDPRADLAVLRIPRATTPLAWADAASVARGDLCLTLGNPDGTAAAGAMSVSVGCVSATGRALPLLSGRERRDYLDLIQTTTPLTAGSSGGPLVNLAGQAIGIVTAVAPAEGAREAIGFALTLSPSTRSAVDQLRRGAALRHAYLGVRVATHPASAATTPVMSGSDVDAQQAGVIIEAIADDAPVAGLLRAGDRILRFAGAPVESGDGLARLARVSGVDEFVPMIVRREGVELELHVRPAHRPQPAEPVTRERQRLVWAGVTFANDPAGGVRVAVIAEGLDVPLARDARFARVNGRDVPDLAALLSVLHDEAGKPLDLDVTP